MGSYSTLAVLFSRLLSFSSISEWSQTLLRPQSSLFSSPNSHQALLLLTLALGVDLLFQIKPRSILVSWAELLRPGAGTKWGGMGAISA